MIKEAIKYDNQNYRMDLLGKCCEIDSRYSFRQYQITRSPAIGILKTEPR